VLLLMDHKNDDDDDDQEDTDEELDVVGADHELVDEGVWELALLLDAAVELDDW
jgi:hypothetical protein